MESNGPRHPDRPAATTLLIEPIPAPRPFKRDLFRGASENTYQPATRNAEPRGRNAEPPVSIIDPRD
ncbi:MAG: hypothetical protein AAGF84_04115 [Planctomycetota bacterium]